jgi:site-specific recombinase XerD
MKGTIRVTVKVSWRTASGERRMLQRERRFVHGTPARIRNAWKTATRAKLEKRIPAAADRTKVAGTLKADADRYYPLIRHLADWVSRRSEIRAWFPRLGDRYRHTITREDVLHIRGQWVTDGLAARTINNRVSALRDLYRKLDGDDAYNPCDRVTPLTPPRTPIQRIDVAVINGVLDNLLKISTEPIRTGRFRGRPRMHALQDRARLMVLASTGKRPCEVERAQPSDVNMTARVWGVRDAKHGWSEGLYLNDEMLLAWQTFAAADAWGAFPDHFPRRLREAGWPAGVRVYNVRHSTWIEASERGADLSDIQAGAGHRNLATTREHYVPVLRSRMQKLSEMIDHRFGWAEEKG